jgi:acetate kinase
VGDFDPFALPLLMRLTGKNLQQLFEDLSQRSGLLGISGLSADVRDLEQAAAEGHARADLALNVFAAEIRRYLGSYLALLNGADAIVFTGGIGSNSVRIRRDVCRNLDFAGIRLSRKKNESARGECRISKKDSRSQIWVVPTNEELVVARQTATVVNDECPNGE